MAQLGFDAGDGFAFGEDQGADGGFGDVLADDDSFWVIGLEVAEGCRSIENVDAVRELAQLSGGRGEKDGAGAALLGDLGLDPRFQERGEVLDGIDVS